MNESLEKILWPDVSSYTAFAAASDASDWQPAGGTIIDGLIDVKPADKEWLDTYEYVPPKPQQPWVIFDEANDLFTYTIAAGGRVGPRMAKPHECIHCYKPRHPEPITERVAQMLAAHRLDPDYDPDTDDSPIVCIGSDYEGPTRPPSMKRAFPLSSATYTMADLQNLQTAPWKSGPGWASIVLAGGTLTGTKFTLPVESWFTEEEQK